MRAEPVDLQAGGPPFVVFEGWETTDLDRYSLPVPGAGSPLF